MRDFVKFLDKIIDRTGTLLLLAFAAHTTWAIITGNPALF